MDELGFANFIHTPDIHEFMFIFDEPLDSIHLWGCKKNKPKISLSEIFVFWGDQRELNP